MLTKSRIHTIPTQWQREVPDDNDYDHLPAFADASSNSSTIPHPNSKTREVANEAPTQISNNHEALPPRVIQIDTPANTLIALDSYKAQRKDKERREENIGDFSEAEVSMTMELYVGGKGIAVTAQPVNLHGNNRMFVCTQLPIQEHKLDFPDTFIVKQVDNQDEHNTYEQIQGLQGSYIPRCYGETTWHDKEVQYTGIALEFLEGYGTLEPGMDDQEKALIQKKCEAAIEAIGMGGVYHGDIAFRNLMWHPFKKEIRVIDFECSKSKMEEWVRDNECRRALGRRSPSFQEQNFIDLRSIFRKKYSRDCGSI
ncbi:hypothetical protein HYALB_00000976 [Hymenoscyphus albidus]|uniref:Uncharacterized protein n=1 Tax=Hymenoscyphus albidus TaxID=595503 RepID=A0A9N9Q7E9_9HELO|nr:hypothetical protein HYALB_00000976 [Hymenoscyphus albidus]